jgi:hypothetical protein
MSEVELKKNQIVSQLQRLCAHCANGREHSCPLQDIAVKVQSIKGVPLIVNDEFRGMIWT